MISQNTKRFEWKPFLKMLFSLAIPVALQNLFSTTGTMIDTMMIGRIGETEVGAVGLCAQFAELFFSSYWGFIGGGVLFFSQYWGADDHDGINRAYGLTFVCVMAVSLLFTVMGTAFPGVVLRLYTDKPAIQAIGIRYMRIAGYSYLLNGFATLMVALLRSTEKVKIPLFAGICSVLTNVLFNYLLIYGKLGFPAMGVEGAAVATVISQVVNVGVIMLLVKVKKLPFVLEFSQHFHFKKQMVKQFFIKCAPIIANEMLIGVANMVISMVLGRQSESAIAAVAVLRTMEGLLIGFFAGFSNAAAVVVGKEVGAGRLENAYARAIRIVYICMAILFCVGGTVLIFHTPILHLMGLSGESFSICTGMLCIYCTIAIIRMGSNWLLNDTFRSSGDSRFGASWEISTMWAVNIPLVVIMGLVVKAPVLVVFLCCYSDEIPRCIIMMTHLYRGKWVKPVTSEGIAALPEFRKNHNIKVKEKKKA